jgi:hypothetical protein
VKFKLFVQLPKPKEIGVGVIDIGQNGTAHFFIKDRLVAEMVRVRLEWMAVKGLYLNGMELAGYDRNGTPKYRYQEWFLAFLEEEK